MKMGHYYVKKTLLYVLYYFPKIRQMPYNFRFDKKSDIDLISDSKWNPFNAV